MQRERWVRLEQLFAQAKKRAPAEREAWLARTCGGDAEMFREVAELLRADATPGMLDTFPFAGEGAKASSIGGSLPAGTRVGSWLIEKLVGRGGMGEVYAATRADAEFIQRGALKLLRFEAIGELARFHAERQILARLDHPGIARLLDGGVAYDGRPYTVMAFVEGTSLLDYCNARNATLHERLDLLAQVCDAVSYAHRNLIIHRDLKPANTLVDAEGNVRLLDFGIAKLIDASASPDAADPNVTVAPFTPDYAAPEQLAGAAVTTAADVYALGVLLFELLTGERPLRTRGLPSAQAFAVLTDRDAPLASRIASEKNQSPMPANALAGDLDAIIAKCLRREPTHRYESVGDLKLDVQRHLNHEPVLAREGARLYVFGRVLRRYRWPVAAAAALILALAAGLAGTLWQARKAQTQTRTAMAVQTFVTDLFRANSSNQKDPVKARATSARELLDIGAKKIDTEMTDAPAAKVAVLDLLGDLYDQLGLHDEEVRLRRQSVELTRTLYGSDSLELVAALSALSGAMHGTDVADDREPLLREALAILDRRGDKDSELRGRLLQKFAETYERSDQPKGLEYARESVRVFSTHPPSAALAESWYLQGTLETYTQQYSAAAESLKHAIEICIAAQGERDPDLIFYYYQLAETQILLRNFDAAEHSAKQALQMALAINGEDHIDAVRARMMLASVWVHAGRMREGLELLERVKRDVLRIAGPDDPFHTRDVLELSGRSDSDFGDTAEGLADLQAELAILRRTEPDGIYTANVLQVVVSDLTDLGRHDEAYKMIDEIVRIYAANGRKPGTPGYNTVVSGRARLAQAEGRPDEVRRLLDGIVLPDDATEASAVQASKSLLDAEFEMENRNEANKVDAALAQARAAITKSGIEGNQRKRYVSAADLIEGESHLLRGEANAAMPLLQSALTSRAGFMVSPSPRLAEAQSLLGQCYLEIGNRAAAQELADAAAAIVAHYAQLSEQYRRPVRQLQAKLHDTSKSTSAHIAARAHI